MVKPCTRISQSMPGDLRKAIPGRGVRGEEMREGELHPDFPHNTPWSLHGMTVGVAGRRGVIVG